MTGRRVALPAAIACAVILAGCSSPAGDAPTTPDEVRPDVSAAACDDPDAALTQAEWVEFCAATEASAGPVSVSVTGGPHAWPDGITAEVLSATTEPVPEYGNPTNDTRVLVTVGFGNTGTDPFVWGESGPEAVLLYGANRYEASAYAADGNNLPRQLLPGTTAPFNVLAYMPATETADLALSVTPGGQGAHEPVILTDVQTLLGLPVVECVGYGCPGD